MAELNGGFNDIGLVDVEIRSPMGTLAVKNFGPSDTVVEAQPGNNGNIMDVVEGSTGQVLYNKAYNVKNWSVTLTILQNSPDYTKLTYMIQEMLAGHITLVGLKIRNRNFGEATSAGGISAYNETLEAEQAGLVNFQGVRIGARISGDYTVTFKCNNATYSSGAYVAWGNKYSSDPMQDSAGSVTYAGTADTYNGVNY